MPPSEAGAVKFTVACVFPSMALPMVGAPGEVPIPVLEELEGE
ncbi:hypothetical protein [Geobacter sp. AOG1]|nr:hypothetical protein [Geobacter sp. AOG1]